jgi:hypothetical protein
MIGGEMKSMQDILDDAKRLALAGDNQLQGVQHLCVLLYTLCL